MAAGGQRTPSGRAGTCARATFVNGKLVERLGDEAAEAAQPEAA
jgi:hypothetical protein